MKGNEPTLYPNVEVGQKVLDYSAECSTKLPQHLVEYHEQIDKNHEDSILMISNFQSQLSVFLAKLIGAKRGMFLEIGVFVGFSSMVWSHAVGPDGTVTGLEFDPEYAAAARETFKKYGVKNVEIIEGDALETVKSLSPAEPYDVIFIDAQKSGYPAYLRTILSQSPAGSGAGSRRLLRKGGLILADNVLRRGVVADPTASNPWSEVERAERGDQAHFRDLAYIDEFNRALAADDRLDTVLLPMFDGLGCAMLKD